MAYEGLTEHTVTLHETGVSPSSVYHLHLTDEHTAVEYLIIVELSVVTERYQKFTLSESQKEPLRGGRYLYKIYAEPAEVESVDELTTSYVETGLLTFEDTRDIDPIYK